MLKRQIGTTVLVCRRVGGRTGSRWQFPQGGVKGGRANLLAEARRELREEIGTDRIRVVRISSRRYCYEIPQSMRRPDRPFVGQCHWWVLGELLAPDEAIRFDLHTPEFDAFEWVEPSEALARVVAFKREAYREAMCDLGLLPHNNSTGKS